MKKSMLVVAALVLGATFASADTYDVYNNGGQQFGTVDVPSTPGPQGPAGLNGTNGTNGTDGVNGTNGTNGKDGANGKDAKVNRHFTESNLVADTAVRLYDGKRVQLQAFNVFAFGRHNGDDIFGDGRNMQYGVRFVYKLGKSYEERELAKQSAEIKALRAELQRLVK